MNAYFSPFVRFLTVAVAALIASLPAYAHTETAPRSRGNTFNPDIGISTLLLYQNSNRGNDPTSDPQNGLDIQEIELQFTADVDPYSRLVAIFALHSHLEVGSVPGEPAERHFHFEPEELYAESLAVPYVTLRAGKFKAAFGRHNLLHTHTYPFIDAPLAQEELLGHEGLIDMGVSAALLLPMPWYSELTLQALSGHHPEVFGAPSPNAGAGVVHFGNLWDVSEATTLQLGLSAAHGTNEHDRPTDLWGADLTLKWRPLLGGTRRSVVWSSELIAKEAPTATSLESGLGWVSYLQLQFTQRWWLQARAESLQTDSDDPSDGYSLTQRKQSALIAFLPTEFSGFRLQYDRLRDGAPKDEHKVSLQMSFSIGAHPAHIY